MRRESLIKEREGKEGEERKQEDTDKVMKTECNVEVKGRQYEKKIKRRQK